MKTVFVDTSALIAAKELGIKEIFTADHHFEQAGFEILLIRTGI